MKRKIRFWKKLIIFYKFLLEKEGYGLEASCDHCDSSKIDRIKAKVFVVDENTKKYQATYRCMDCGAIADVHETWKKS